MDDKKLYHKYPSKEDRLADWQEKRAVYAEWRNTPEGERWVKRKSNDQLGLCFICMTALNPPIHVDHIFPLYLGGTSNPANMCVTHADCNMRKGAKVYMTYKEACTRRALFNDLRRGIQMHRLLKKNPSRNIGKRGSRLLKLATQYLSEYQLDNMVIDSNRKADHEERLARRRASNAFIG